ncbi:gliding motility-associated protein GldC [Dyadobacter jejuensis]|uniref:Gliding motility-associated protein GldC n=1 Tax=Dyadobacter jejuensis TaxID=1082580 RepID=A0A316AMV1_9BACT|nr:gliding motility protein GldC [Dyadobacter jejuensis]PWJ58896.1 gliding motility-associated protein GldC [Dyadobacter jejuensis]
MKKSDINFNVELDSQNIPEKIYWNATDNPNEGINDTRAIAIGVWDHYHRGTLKIDLWTKDMEVFDMKRFYIELMSGIADTLLTATNDKVMADAIEGVCGTLSKKLDEEIKAAAKEA